MNLYRRRMQLRWLETAFLWSVQFPMSSRFTSSFRAGRKIILQFTDTQEIVLFQSNKLCLWYSPHMAIDLHDVAKAPCHIRAVIGLLHCVSTLLTSNVMTSLVHAVGRKKCRNVVKLVRLMIFSSLLYLSR